MRGYMSKSTPYDQQLVQPVILMVKVTFCSLGSIMKVLIFNQLDATKISGFKCTCTMTLIFDLVGQGHLLLTIFDDVEIHVKISFLR